MPRLFVALSLPSPIISALEAVVKPTVEGCRWSERDNWHITLHFIGDSAIEPIDALLQSINGNPFNLSLTQPGYFSSRQRGFTYWWGVERNEDLLTLQQSIREKITVRTNSPPVRHSVEGEKSYNPHITLARCNPKTNPQKMSQFLHQPLNDDNQFWVDRFCLYSSHTKADGADYRIEKTYRLEKN